MTVTSSYHAVKINGDVRIHYRRYQPASGTPKGTILLIHGFPQTGHQFRHVQSPLAEAGYQVVVPDYRGAGYSSRPNLGAEAFTKSLLASDLHYILYDHMKISKEEPVYVVGHDIGGMVAFAYAAAYTDEIKAVIWGECPLPGSQVYEGAKGSPLLWHFTFQNVPSLPEQLVVGHEKLYLRHFYHNHSQNPGALSDQDVDYYANVFSQEGGWRCAFNLYRAFELDAQENKAFLEKNGKMKLPCLMLFGDGGPFSKEVATSMGDEWFESYEVAMIKDAGHWLAEEQPQGFIDALLGYIANH